MIYESEDSAAYLIIYFCPCLWNESEMQVMSMKFLRSILKKSKNELT
jgi:hypothetical protein